MELQNCVALVTGANRGLGKAFTEALLAAGAAKVYAGARDTSSILDSRLTPVQLDVTKADDVSAAAQRCQDVTLLINNAGVFMGKPILGNGSEGALRAELDVNVFGVQRMMHCFAPVLGKNGGGAIVNVLSVVSWFVNPDNGTYCASKHAALALTDGARIQLKSQGTRVVGVYAGYIDTDMAAGINAAKSSPQQVVERALEGVRDGVDHVLANQRAHDIWQAMRADPGALHAQMQGLWDSSHATTKA